MTCCVAGKCKNCKGTPAGVLKARAYGRRIYQANRAAAVECARQYRKAHASATAAWHRQYYQKYKDRILQRSRKYQQDNAEKIQQQRRTYRTQNAEKISALRRAARQARVDVERANGRAYYAQNAAVIRARATAKRREDPGRARASSKRYRETHKEKIKQLAPFYGKKHYQENKSDYRARAALRRARNRAATPAWLGKDHLRQIKEIYRQCPKGWEVDHIIPIIHPDVCGLHVPWNLQHLPMTLNRQKGNRLHFWVGDSNTITLSV